MGKEPTHTCSVCSETGHAGWGTPKGWSRCRATCHKKRDNRHICPDCTVTLGKPIPGETAGKTAFSLQFLRGQLVKRGEVGTPKDIVQRLRSCRHGLTETSEPNKMCKDCYDTTTARFMPALDDFM